MLRGINMEVEKGEFIAIEGPSGSGKTDFIVDLRNDTRPDSGIYLLDGMEMTTDGIDLATIRNSRIGFVFQDHRLMPQYTVLEISFYRLWRQLPDVHER